jgi:hypothetical protein
MKKTFLLTLFITICFAANATTYYISANGNDAYSGTSSSTPWKSLSKLNSFFGSLSPGDNVLLNRGETFYGNITISKSGSSGSPITIGAYGTGANPLVTGFTNVNTWTNIGGNIWESTGAISGLSMCNMVVINNIRTSMGRTPNTGWYTYQSFSGDASITSNSLNSVAINWTGAQVVIRKNPYVIDKGTINSQSGATLNYTDIGSGFYSPTANYGFFIQNDPRTLDVQNEWYFDASTKKIKIYSITLPTNVQVVTLDNNIYSSGSNSIVINGVNFQGSNQDAVLTYGCSNWIINARWFKQHD